jgi:hypothetical protein
MTRAYQSYCEQMVKEVPVHDTGWRTVVARRRCLIISAAVLIAAMLGTSCSADVGSAGPAATGSPSATAPPAEPETSPAETPEEQAKAQAIAVVRDFIAVFDQLYADPNREVTELDRLAQGKTLEWATGWLTRDREKGRVAVGTEKLIDIKATSVTLNAADTPSGHPTVRVETCIDLTGFDIVDREGKSVVLPTRPDRVAIDWEVWLVSDNQWRVTETGWVRDNPDGLPTC